jgi:hypothetical protein
VVNEEGPTDTVCLPGYQSTMNVTVDEADQGLCIGVTL